MKQKKEFEKEEVLPHDIEITQTEDETELPDFLPEQEAAQPIPVEQLELPIENKILLSFAGDIMAHSNVTRMSDFSLIYTDITSIIQNDDLTFANLETPIHPQRAYENYPTFNVQPPFVDAAISAGFEVFSLANNHTNDQGKSGIDHTLSYFTERRNGSIFSAGIKDTQSSNLTFEIIEKNGFTILFAAFTEILNSLSHAEYIDYIQPSNTAREILKKQLMRIRETHPCDLFILSIHSNEPEYVIEVAKARKTFYYDLLDCGIDIVWANHPHVPREWEFMEDKHTGLLTKAVFYGLGNTISGQRYVYNFGNPSAIREYTGDGMLFQIEFTKEQDSAPFISFTNLHFITTHVDAEKNSLIKLFTPEFIDSQNDTYKDYYTKRLELLTQIKGTTLCR